MFRSRWFPPRLPRLRGGMAAVAAAGSVALAVTAGVVLSGTPRSATPAAPGVLQSYAVAPTQAWTLDDSVLPGVGGGGAITVAATDGDDWLIAYPAGIRREYLLIDARNGSPRWDRPVDAGFGACAINERHQVGCAIRLRIDGPENGFYLVDRSNGELTRTSDGDDTAALLGFGDGFVHVNQTGYQVSLRTPDGATRWSRTFAAAATATDAGGALLVSTADDTHHVIDPADGTDRLSCSQCTVDVYPGGLAVTSTRIDHESVAFHPFTAGGVSRTPVGTASRMRVVRGPSTLPVLAPAGTGSALDAAGRYEIVDPATGRTRWRLDDPELSKASPRPCGPVLSVARKDRSRVFFDLADGTRRGESPPPALDDPDANLDSATCLGASDEVAVFANPNQLTAVGVDSGRQVWSQPLLGSAESVDGTIVLRQGSTLTALRPD
ncbi:PQQ-binding-like beta-propeller repeat protein [Gordonia sp. (in: high G+C Gram-positive bacteria)]|uniref:outer membrane protein assembly factor BamB family protein n=1 Tax=Gordonia sp. (in: high G+C Gram-positive bacteria) TaxID=84139 RepID=UPI003C76E785